MPISCPYAPRSSDVSQISLTPSSQNDSRFWGWIRKSGVRQRYCSSYPMRPAGSDRGSVQGDSSQAGHEHASSCSRCSCSGIYAIVAKTADSDRDRIPNAEPRFGRRHPDPVLIGRISTKRLRRILGRLSEAPADDRLLDINLTTLPSSVLRTTSATRAQTIRHRFAWCVSGRESDHASRNAREPRPRTCQSA